MNKVRYTAHVCAASLAATFAAGTGLADTAVDQTPAVSTTLASPSYSEPAQQGPAQTQSELELLRATVERLRWENEQLKNELAALKQTEVAGERSTVLEPEFVKPFTPVMSGSNNSNPTWSNDGRYLGYERTEERKKEIVIAENDGSILQHLAYQSNEDNFGLDLLLPGFDDSVKYNAGLTWSGTGDRFVFMSNGSEGNYDLYLGSVGGTALERLTEHPEKEGQAHWSPTADAVVYISGRDGSPQVYHLDIATRQSKKLTSGEKNYLYPQWSPDGKRIALIYGSNQNHDVVVIDDLTQPQASMRFVSRWLHDDLRPTWSPDGKKIAFYSNYNDDNDPKIWSIVVVDADGGPDPRDLSARVVASNVIPDIERGPAWLPDSQTIAYVKNDRGTYNPIYLADTRTGESRLLNTDTKINHDISVSRNGLIAFRAQVEQWDQIFVTKLKDGDR